MNHFKGICEPLDSPACKGRNYFLKCRDELEPCLALTEEGKAML